MHLTQVKHAIETTPHGALIVVEWTRPVKTRKAFNEIPIVKDVRMVGRIGVSYDNIGEVKEKRESGELPAVNQGLRGEQVWESPCIIFNPKNNQRAVRLANGISKTTKNRVQYRIADTVVKKDDIADMMLKSELEKKKGNCFQVNIANLRRIHAEIADDSDIAETQQEMDEMAIRFAEEDEMKSLEDAMKKIDLDLDMLND